MTWGRGRDDQKTQIPLSTDSPYLAPPSSDPPRNPLLWLARGISAVLPHEQSWDFAGQQNSSTNWSPGSGTGHREKKVERKKENKLLYSTNWCLSAFWSTMLRLIVSFSAPCCIKQPDIGLSFDVSIIRFHRVPKRDRKIGENRNRIGMNH